MAQFSDPFETLVSLQQALDTFRTSRWLGAGPSAGGSYPPMNVFRKGDGLIVIAEVPGIKKSDLEVQVKGNTLRLAGTKSVNYPDKQHGIAASDLPADSIGPSRCPSKSSRRA